MLTKFFPRKSVASILAVFTTCVEQLRALANDKLEEAMVKNARCREIMREVEEAEDEAQAALEAADKIEALVSATPVIEAAAEKL